jgi:hypothetical protein
MKSQSRKTFHPIRPRRVTQSDGRRVVVRRRTANYVDRTRTECDDEPVRRWQGEEHGGSIRVLRDEPHVGYIHQ